jgi:hypothetical protein
VRYDIPVAWCATPETAARQIELWSFYFSAEYVKRVNDLLRAAHAIATETAKNISRAVKQDALCRALAPHSGVFGSVRGSAKIAD